MTTPTNIEIRAENNPHAAGYVYFYAFVTPAAATGTVYWYVDQAYVRSNGLTNGLVLLNNMNITPAGSHLVTAVYEGDTNYAPSSTVIVQTAS